MTVFVGDNFGKLTTIERIKTIRKSGKVRWVWICQCECGRRSRVEEYRLTKLSQSGCMSCSRKTGYMEISGTYWNSLKISAKRRGIRFSLSIKDAWNKFLEQERRCILTGMEIQFEPSHGKMSNKTASLDRKNSNRGYVKDNIQWVHKEINNMKRAMSEADFILFCTHVTMHRGA